MQIIRSYKIFYFLFFYLLVWVYPFTNILMMAFWWCSISLVPQIVCSQLSGQQNQLILLNIYDHFIVTLATTSLKSD